jgi:predicted ATPase/DNA-binding SARP family transcriptional activator
MSRLDIALLGPPEIKIHERVVKTDRRKAIALLAYLSVTGKSHTRDHLAGLLWPDYERDSAYAYLRRTLWELNQILGKGRITLDRERVSIEATAELWVDTVAFETCSHTSPGDLNALERAATLYRGDFLEGFRVADTAPFEEWQFQQAEYFRREFANVLERLVEAYIQAGEQDPALLYAHRWLAIDPLDEAAHRAIMRLLAGMGDRTGAIRQYENCAKTLKAELGIPPQPETTQLYQAILRGEVRTTPVDQVTPSKAVESHPSVHLPAMPTPFIGRRPEVEQVKTLLQNPAHRLVTLAGPGGTGKTRLSIQVASEVGSIFPDGVYFVPLAAVPTKEAVLPTLAKAIDFSFYRDERPRQQLINYLQKKRLLLVLDNFEHLLDATELVAEILENAPDVKILTTSRVRLNVQGEQLFLVEGMRSPDAGVAASWDDPEKQARPFSAVQLFLDRARRMQPNFTLSKTNLMPVLEICRLVQGMPLGLELAAAWMELLPPSEIAAEIARSLDFLETDQAGVPDRQRSIRAVFESSWNFLSEDEQSALQRLCVFRGSFSLQASQQVSGASLRVLLGLVNKSWLQQTSNGRFQLHELLRYYGLEQLKTRTDEWREAHNRHADYFTGFIAEQTSRMQSSEQLDGIKALEEELNSNVKATWDWLVAEGHWEAIIHPFAVGLFLIGTSREQMAEMIPWLREARLKLASESGELECLAFAIVSTLEVLFEENEDIKDYHPLERLATTWQFVIRHHLAKPMGLWFALLATMIHSRNLDPAAEAQLEEAIARIRAENDPWKLGIALLLQSGRWGEYAVDEEVLLEAAQIFKDLGVWYEQGLVAEMLGRRAVQQRQPLAVVLDHFQRAKQFFRKMGEETRATGNFVYLTGLYFREGMIEQGFATHHETQRALERVGNTRWLAANMHWESLHAVRYSTFEHALDTQQRSLELIIKLDNQSDYYWGLFELGDIYRVFGETQKARALYEEAYAGFNKLDMALGLGYYQRAAGDLALGEARYAEALERYEQYLQYAMLDNHAWSTAQARTKRALALAYLEDHKQARLEIYNVLTEIRDWGEDELMLHALLVELVCLIQEGQNEQAVEFAVLIGSHPVTWNEIRQQAQAILESAARGLPEEATQVAIQNGKALSLDALIATVISRAIDYLAG